MERLPCRSSWVGQLPIIQRIVQISDIPYCSNTVKNERPSVAQDVIVRDITGEETKYNLDDNGFQFLHHESKETHFEDADKIKSKYHPEVEQLLKDV